MRPYVPLALLLAAFATVGTAPTLAQSFSHGYGTGNLSGSADQPEAYQALQPTPPL